MIKVVLTDVDGCLTDGSILYSNEGQKFKKFNMHDGMAVRILEKYNIKCGIISSDDSISSKNRAQDLKMDYIYINKKNKIDVLYEIVEKEKISLDYVAYMGDDIQDLEIIEKVGFSAAPNNAVETVKKKVNFVTKKNGGEGAFREFVEKIIKMEGKK